MIKEISIDITNKCPFHCIHCSNDRTLKRIELPLIEFNKIMEYFHKFQDVKVIEFGGGEPFLHQNFFEFLKLAQSIENKILYTSGCIGLYGGDSLSYSDALKLKQSGLTQVNVSVYSHQPEIHNHIVQLKDGFERVSCSLKNLGKSDIKVCIHILVTKLNYSSLFEIIEALNATYNIESFRLLRFVSQGVGKSNSDTLRIPEIQDLFDIFSKLQKVYGKKISIGGYPQFLKCRPHKEILEYCAAGVEFVHIMPDGTIIPCPSFKGLCRNEKYGFSLESFKKLCHNWTQPGKRYCWRQKN